MVFTPTLIALLLALCLLSLFTAFPRPLSAVFVRVGPNGLFGAQILGVVLWQLSRIRAAEYNVDESTWIANALAVLRENDFASALLTYTTARPLTVLPLIGLDALHLPINFYSVNVIALGCIALTLWLTYLSLRNLTTARHATLFLFPLIVFYVAVEFDDFLAYNSELVCNICVVAGIWLYSGIVRKRDRVWQIGLVGVLMGLLPFVKFQAIPGALVVAAFCLYEWVRQGRWRLALGFVGAGLLPLLVVVSYCLLTNQLTFLIRNYFLYYFYYSYQYSDRSLAERLWPGSLLFYYRKQFTFAAYWFGLIGLMGVGVWQARRSLLRSSSTLLLMALLWVVSIYETIQAGTNYEHYLNLVLVPHTLLAAVLIYQALVRGQLKAAFVAPAYVVVALFITFFSRTKPFERGYEPPLPYDSAVVAFIKQNCRPQDRIAVWGWADRYYVLSGVAPASRYVNSVLQIKPNGQQAYHLDQYVRDLQRNRPVLFIDAVAANQFTYDKPRLYGHERFPAVNRIVQSSYQFVFERQGLRVYRLKTAHSAVHSVAKLASLAIQ